VPKLTEGNQAIEVLYVITGDKGNIDDDNSRYLLPNRM